LALSSTGAGASITRTNKEQVDLLYAMAEDRGQPVRLDWVGLAPPLKLRDHRAAVAALVPQFEWRLELSYLFRWDAHINLLELAVLSYVRRVCRRRRVRRARLLLLSDSAVVCGASAKGRWSSRRLNHLLRNLAGLALRYEIKVELIWTPTWANPGDPPSRRADLEEMLADLPRRLEEWSASRLQEQSELEEEAGREGSYSEGGRAE
jgi:hypothetical protein